MPELPIGSISAYGGPIDAAFEAATGWMLCDGRSLNRINESSKRSGSSSRQIHSKATQRTATGRWEIM